MGTGAHTSIFSLSYHRAMPRPTTAGIDSIIAVRGAVIALLAIGIGLLPDVQSGPGLSTRTWVALGIAMQCTIVVARWFAQRYERAHRLEGSVVPIVMQVGTLCADGATVLMCGLAVFNAQFARLAPL